MRFNVHAPACIHFAAIHLVHQLNKLGHQATLIDKINHRDETMHIIYNPAALDSTQRLPKNFIIYQTEVAGSAWFHNGYLKMIAQSVGVWEYSAANHRAYSHLQKPMAVVSPGITRQRTGTKDIPVLFYGWIDGCKRRNDLLQRINKRIPVKIVTNAMQGNMWELLNRAKVVLNIHYYEKAPLETFRINEALSFNCHVVSEKSISGDDKYYQHIQFGTTWEALAARCADCSKIPFEVNTDALDNLNEIREGLKLLNCW